MAPRSWASPSDHTPGNCHDWRAKLGEGLRFFVCLHSQCLCSLPPALSHLQSSLPSPISAPPSTSPLTLLPTVEKVVRREQQQSRRRMGWLSSPIYGHHSLPPHGGGGYKRCLKQMLGLTTAAADRGSQTSIHAVEKL
ncbi:unnamed protein product [Schistocephalus solidus]|uniref:Uncharacterized protein n=1 Tax=Schistocephalus solidus TaxID=70667 RepID=A0A183SAU9_SCHSO|nr:unnamed protein product [Schistocephalus solidus]